MRPALLIFILSFITPLMMVAQNNNNNENIDPADAESIFTVVDEMPEFVGGEEAMFKFIDKNLKYPMTARDKGIQGKVWASFVVKSDGTLSNITIVSGIGGGCDEEVIRVIQLMPNWKPAKQSGIAVNCQMRLPVNFTLK